jgi:hypothetical protein
METKSKELANKLQKKIINYIIKTISKIPPISGLFMIFETLSVVKTCCEFGYCIICEVKKNINSNFLI